MADLLKDFRLDLNSYINNNEKANSEPAKAFLFVEFIRKVFGKINTDYLERLYPYIEKYVSRKESTVVIRGRIDALLGNLIIEFKMNLDRDSIDVAKRELKTYISVLWSEDSKRRINYIAIATDGINFVAYRPRAISEKDKLRPEDITLDEIDKLNIKKSKSDDIFIWLDRYLLIKELKPATTDLFSNEFGLNKPAFLDVEPLLKDAWKNFEERVVYEQWASFLRIVYGTKVDS